MDAGFRTRPSGTGQTGAHGRALPGRARTLLTGDAGDEEEGGGGGGNDITGYL